MRCCSSSRPRNPSARGAPVRPAGVPAIRPSPRGARRAAARRAFARSCARSRRARKSRAELLHLPHIRQQLALGLGQIFEDPLPPAVAEQRLEMLKLSSELADCVTASPSKFQTSELAKPASNSPPVAASQRTLPSVSTGTSCNARGALARICPVPIQSPTGVERKLRRELKPLEGHIERER